MVGSKVESRVQQQVGEWQEMVGEVWKMVGSRMEMKVEGVRSDRKQSRLWQMVNSEEGGTEDNGLEKEGGKWWGGECRRRGQWI